MMIYLDYAATTPMSEEALETYIAAAKHISEMNKVYTISAEVHHLYYKFVEKHLQK